MFDMIPTPYRMAAFGIALLLVFLFGVGSGGALAVRHYEPQLAEANRKAGEMENAYLTLAAVTTQQNNAINALHDAGEERKAAAIAAAKQANGEAQGYYGRGQTILGLRPPPGADPCRNARDAFDDELRAERGAR
ncbi:MAG: hypothetical protein Q7U97_10760 [Rhodocyclaceae bacterium]|nr:hypothetical protein [Rhodocyclaceae bacterium]